MATQSVSSIATASKACLTNFDALLSSLGDAEEPRRLMDPSSVQNLRDRFRVWTGNLGALKAGRASLDFRLEESTLMHKTVLRSLDQLQGTINRSIEVVQGLRPPWETAFADDVALMSDSSSASSTSCDEDQPNTRTELGQNMFEMINIVSDLFKLGFQIRNPAMKSATPSVLNALVYEEMLEVDDTTSVDLLACYFNFDLAHVKEHFKELRRGVRIENWNPTGSKLQDVPEVAPKPFPDVLADQMEWENEPGAYLIKQWATSITNRRRYFAYWRRYATKLNQDDEDTNTKDTRPAETTRPQSGFPLIIQNQRKPTPSAFAGTVMSGTEATRYNQSLGNDTDVQSTISYPSTAYDLDGSVADLPSPPIIQPGQLEFSCSFCHITSPVTHAKGKRWREHVLQDLQPYMCTYENCLEADRMFGSRSAWLRHELQMHRKAWRCYGHQGYYQTKEELLCHLKSEHNTIAENQINSIADLSYANIEDVRTECPFCLHQGPFQNSLSNHMAFHMERLAIFAVPRSIIKEDNESSRDGNSDNARGNRSTDSLKSVELEFPSSSSQVTFGEHWPSEVWSDVLKAIETRKMVLGPEDPDTLACIVDLASTYFEKGQYKEAELLEEQVIETRKTALGPTHPDTLVSIANLASIFSCQRRYEEAETLRIQVVETRKTTLGLTHLDTLASMAELASTYSCQRRYREAEALEIRVMETRKTVLGSEHPDTLASMANLASTYLYQKRHIKAESLAVQVVETRKAVLGPEHFDTLASMGKLACIYLDLKQYKEAESLAVQVVETRKAVLGPEHSDTLASMDSLTWIYLDRKQYKEAESLAVQVVGTRKAVLGPEHSDTLASMGKLACIYLDLKQYKEAESLAVQVVETRKAVLGPEHSDTLFSKETLARIWKHQGRNADAVELMEGCMQTRRRVLGPYHKDTVSSLSQLSSWREEIEGSKGKSLLKKSEEDFLIQA